MTEITTTTPTVTGVRRKLIAESRDLHRRLRPHTRAQGTVPPSDPVTQAHLDAREGLHTGGCYAWLLAAMLRQLAEDHGDEYAGKFAGAVHDVMASGLETLEYANDDLGDGRLGRIPGQLELTRAEG